MVATKRGLQTPSRWFRYALRVAATLFQQQDKLWGAFPPASHPVGQSDLGARRCWRFYRHCGAACRPIGCNGVAQHGVVGGKPKPMAKTCGSNAMRQRHTRADRPLRAIGLQHKAPPQRKRPRQCRGLCSISFLALGRAATAAGAAAAKESPEPTHLNSPVATADAGQLTQCIPQLLR